MKANSITILQIGKTGKLKQQIAKENAKKKILWKNFLTITHSLSMVVGNLKNTF